ncbi:MAG: Plug domain-containing protein, partial [Comamonas sp.]
MNVLIASTARAVPSAYFSTTAFGPVEAVGAESHRAGHSRLRSVALACCSVVLGMAAAQAQTPPAEGAAAAAPAPAAANVAPQTNDAAATASKSVSGNESTLHEVEIRSTAWSLEQSTLASPAQVLEGEALEARRSATLGETLANEPGVQATHFGAGASRPVIRGMDGPRVQVLSSGSAVQDASSVSPDHAVMADAMLAEQIEVLRGPSALLYGGAVGGVVNVLDGKIPTAVPENGIQGSAQARYSTADRGKTGAFALTGGQG